MKKEIRTVVYDEQLHLEAYRLEGIVQPFPNHFHDHYVIGFIEDGERCLSCKANTYTLSKGNIVLFNPNDNHACVQSDGRSLDYRAFNLPKETMLALTKEITGDAILPHFSETVIVNDGAVFYLRPLHEMVMEGSCEFEKEETLLLLLSLLIQNYGQPFDECTPECNIEIDKACRFMEEHFTERLCLDQICRHCGLSKSTLLRSFTKARGITPYRYLETIRINKAKKLLETGISPVEAAVQTGFSDQSHFTKYFNRFIGLPPGMYREIFIKNAAKDIKRHGE